MPNWCANRIEISVSAERKAEVLAWVNGELYPYYQRAINQSIRLFLAGVIGRLKPATDVIYKPYPALTAHGCGEASPETDAFTQWLGLLQSNAQLDEQCCDLINRYYIDSGISGLKRDDLSAFEQAKIDEIIKAKSHDWISFVSGSCEQKAFFDRLDSDVIPNETFSLLYILPTRLACEINGYNGRLLDGISSTYHQYTADYGTKWPSNCDVSLDIHGNTIVIDVDTAWTPPCENVIEAMSERWQAVILHYYSEAGCDFCGYRQYIDGSLMDLIDGCLEYEDCEDDDCYAEVIGPDWLVDNITHYGG